MRSNLIYYFIFILYVHFIGTNIEYFLHRFIIHNSNNVFGKHHIKHHQNTLDDMSLKLNNSNENLIFNIKEILAIAILIGIFMYIAFNFFKVNKIFYFIIPLFYILWEWIVWNSIHPYCHGKSGRDFTVMALNYETTEYLVKKYKIFKWIVENLIINII